MKIVCIGWKFDIIWDD